MTGKSIFSILALLIGSVCISSAWVSATDAASGTHAEATGVPGSESLGDGWYSSQMLGDYVHLDDDWYWSDWLGYFNYDASAGSSWIYSMDLEWCFISDNANASSSLWFWIQSLADWSWTTASQYPNVYLANVGSWCWYDALLKDFYNYSTGRYIIADNGGSNGGDLTVDLVLINTGGIPQSEWEMATDLYVKQFANFGTHTVFSENNELIIRYHPETQAVADQLRNALQQAYEGNHEGGIRIEVR